MIYLISGYEILIKHFLNYWVFTGWIRLGEASTHVLC